jgi:hypothetical protein
MKLAVLDAEAKKRCVIGQASWTILTKEALGVWKDFEQT